MSGGKGVSDLGAGEQLDREWVSKTQFVRHLRCPYICWLVDTGQIAAEDAWTSIQARLIAEGRQFQEGIIGALPVAIDVRSLADVIAQDARVLGLNDLYRNERLKILGTPDGVDAAGGALFPIEIKSHKEVLASDRLELAFYYLLLEPIAPMRLTRQRAMCGYGVKTGTSTGKSRLNRTTSIACSKRSTPYG